MSQLAFSSILVTRQTCRLCGSRALTSVVSLGDQHIGGAFAKPDCTPPVQRRIPLDLVRCDPALDQDACGLVQMRHSVPPKVLYASYWYRSGVNQTMRDHLAGIAHMAEQIAALKTGDLVLDIGCNDGTLLKSYRTAGIKRLGIDPSNVVAHARAAGLQVVNDFFSANALRSAYPEQKPKVITSIAMFYDLENPHAFVADIKDSLHEEGVWVLELSYLPSMLEINSFDTICHEHLEYYSLGPMERLLAEHGLEVMDVTLNDSNGGSFRIAVGHAGKIKPSDEARERVQQIRLREFEQSFDTDVPYALFRKNIEKIRKDIRAFLKKAKAQKKLVHGYGASTKGNTTLQFCGVTPELLPAIADRNEDKWGTRTVGTNIPIISEEASRKLKPDFYLALPWHFIEEFKKREREFLGRGGKFIIPMPQVHLIGK
ncbi:MAG TPA: class I SAM-dependent methyltransferase [Verrucomicrobiae bacterium]|jgi:SAM-dependent methyltransferase|nr:class I SAM-dependent methyltransferase [Verrucomicrobiae bacterium]